jgi:hypothetical protein
MLATVVLTGVVWAAGDYPPGPQGTVYGQGMGVAKTDRIYGGVTSQGLTARVTAARRGRPWFVDLWWRTRCGRTSQYGEASIPASFDHAGLGAFRDTRSFQTTIGSPASEAQAQGALVNIAVSGRRASPAEWSGTASFRTRMYVNGEPKVRCRAVHVSWSARLPRARITIHGGGGVRRQRTPGAPLYLAGDRRRIYVQGRDWFLYITALPHHRIRTGRLTTASDVWFILSPPPVAGSGCGDDTGEVDVRSSAFDGHGQVRAIAMTVTFPCESPVPTRTIDVVYRR